MWEVRKVHLKLFFVFIIIIIIIHCQSCDKWMLFRCHPCDSKFPQVPRTLLSILADFSNAVVCMIFVYPPISCSSSPFTKHLGTVLSAPITIGIIVTLIFSCFFSSLERSKYSSLFSFSLLFYLLIESFSHQLMVFPWRLSDSKSPQVSRTLLSILAVLNSAVVWMVSTRPPTSKSLLFLASFSRQC